MDQQEKIEQAKAWIVEQQAHTGIRHMLDSLLLMVGLHRLAALLVAFAQHHEDLAKPGPLA